jgi:hypothetical protein
MYKKTVQLKHTEKLLKVDKTTGEVKEVGRGGRPGFKYHNQGESFYKTYNRAWQLLSTQVNNEELSVVTRLAIMAKPYTNSLIPLSPETTVRQLAEVLKINKNKVSKILDKLLMLGVVGKFEVGEMVSSDLSEIRKYYIFNPYLSFNGKTINSDITGLFANTFYARIM